MTQQRSSDDILADLARAGRLVTSLTGSVDTSRMRLLNDVEPLLARVSELEQERNDLRRVEGTDYEVVAYDGEAHVARHYEATSWDSPPEAELMGSVGDLIRRLAETEARAERAEAQRDEALTLLADAVPDPKGAMDSPQWHRRMDALAAGLSLQEEQE